ncbi:FHA domain-containing protein [Aporhodopirellula aestuarii]|uniref:FHA domain-containing protein n=1 Tax=Aporhodopirellula aestuarii TaxID=2950107 RepID=A0ABT0U8L1_9BACT|nr:FHA domain-containing protein [Aporhodopirellula aestuarii]MCM2372743.1 FHA domain-containing protein [Aporhodopirellula aestuarii]
MPQQSWTIGSDSSCDLVVKNIMVSGQHCRLTSDGDELTLTDLNSTNGTYLNGQRLLGTQAISTHDTITLGQTQSMPWPETFKTTRSANTNQTVPSEQEEMKTVITLGRGSDNVLILSDPNVSTHHARLMIKGGKIVLEDLGSTNGTSVGSVENKISRAYVQNDDTIFLGSTAYQVANLLKRSQPTFIDPEIRPSNRNSTRPTNNSTITLATVGAAGLLLALIGWFATRDPSTAETQQPDTPNTMAATSQTVVAKDPVGQAMSDKRKDEPTAGTVKASLSQQEKLSRSLFLIVCSDSKRETPFRVGTGFAIDSQHIATTASVVQAMRNLQQNGFPEAFLFSPTTESERSITSAVIHPRFELANQVARKAQQEHDAIFDQLESQPPKPEAFEKVKVQLVAARMKALEAIDQKMTYDVAIIKTNQSLLHWLPGTAAEVKLRPNQKLNVTGYAFDVEDPYFDRSVPIEASTISSRVGQLAKATQDSQDRMVAKGTPQQHEYAYLGSPVMNAQGKVVGIYSRPTPPNADSDSESEPSFEAALFQRVRECQ